LRSFIQIPPQNEFRVFFVSGCVAAVSQRHVQQFYPHLYRDLSQWSLRIQNFCTIISSKLPLPSCVVDIAFTEQSPQVRQSKPLTSSKNSVPFPPSNTSKGLVIDMDAYCSDTSTLLFSPQDVISAAAAAQHSASPFQFEVRVLQNDTGLQPSPSMYHGMPLDLQVTPPPPPILPSQFHQPAMHSCVVHTEL
jgi:hypothetical protein